MRRCESANSGGNRDNNNKAVPISYIAYQYLIYSYDYTNTKLRLSAGKPPECKQPISQQNLVPSLLLFVRAIMEIDLSIIQNDIFEIMK